VWHPPLSQPSLCGQEICFYQSDGSFHGQLYFGITRWLFGIFPLPPNP